MPRVNDPPRPAADHCGDDAAVGVRLPAPVTTTVLEPDLAGGTPPPPPAPASAPSPVNGSRARRGEVAEPGGTTGTTVASSRLDWCGGSGLRGGSGVLQTRIPSVNTSARVAD